MKLLQFTSHDVFALAGSGQLSCVLWDEFNTVFQTIILHRKKVPAMLFVFK
jgi:hypothetical protein